MRLENIPEQRPELRQMQSTALSHVMVNALATRMQERLKATLVPSKHESLLKSSIGQEHIVYRLAADVLRQKGNIHMQNLLEDAPDKSAEVVFERIYDEAEDDAERVLNVWSQDSHYHAPTQMPGSRDYQRWLGENTGHEDVVDYVPGLLDVLNQRFRFETYDIFHRVRSAQYKPMEEEHIPAVVESYMKSWLGPEALTLLVKKDDMTPEEITANIRSFREKVNKGVFIWPLLEDELRQDLFEERAKRETGMEMKGRVLQATDGKVLCWGTYLQVPHKKTGKHLATVKRYFRRGVTDHKMKIEDPDIERTVFDNLAHIQLFQDIRSSFPLAADRFGPMLFEEMQTANANLKFVTAYRLGNVVTQPKLALLDEAWHKSVYPVENERSAQKFGGWGARHIAWDFNPHGTPSLRDNVKGVLPDGHVALYPRWDVMLGTTKDLAERSRSLWRTIQINHGDISQDPLTYDWEL